MFLSFDDVFCALDLDGFDLFSVLFGLEFLDKVLRGDVVSFYVKSHEECHFPEKIGCGDSWQDGSNKIIVWFSGLLLKNNRLDKKFIKKIGFFTIFLT